MTATIGWVLLVLACWPVLSPRVETGATQALGLLMVCVAALSLIGGTGAGVREWMLLGGMLLAVVGEVMHWRSRGGRWRLYRIVAKMHRQDDGRRHP